jgi:molybdenum cofactor cytidylyltransferase
MQLARALRIQPLVRLALVGAGGKTTALLRLAHELPPPVWVTATTHLGLQQVSGHGRHVIITDSSQNSRIDDPRGEGITFFIGARQQDGRTAGLSGDALEVLRRQADELGLPLLVEADGSRMLPLKAPAAYEPAIPEWASIIAVVAGLSGIGKRLEEGQIHRPEIFAQLSGLRVGEPVNLDAVERVLLHPQGGLKNIPHGAKRVVIYNQADTLEMRLAADASAQRLLSAYDAVLIAALNQGETTGGPVYAVYEPVAAVVLAAGGSERLGRPKQLLPWRGEPMVRRVARTAVEAGCSPVIVVTGAAAEEVKTSLEGLSVHLVHNPDWPSGQSSSVKIGLAALPSVIGGTYFFLSDQPQVPVELVHAGLKAHRSTLAPLVAPRVSGRRANPVLFDRETFPDLMQLSGDAGGRSLFERYAVQWIDWDDPNLLLDVDTPEDYQRLLALDS